MPITEGVYSPERRRANRVTVVVVTVAGVAGALIASATTDWPLTNALGIVALWLIFCASLWWLFGSRKAGPLGLSAGSKAWFKAVVEPYRRRQ